MALSPVMCVELQPAAEPAATRPPNSTLTTSTTTTQRTVTVHYRQTHGSSVAPNFVGLSIEVPDVLRMIGELGNSTALAQVLRNIHQLTPGRLVCGASSVVFPCPLPALGAEEYQPHVNLQHSTTASLSARPPCCCLLP